MRRAGLMTSAFRIALLAAAGVALMRCDSIREAAGVTKQPPDEFAVAAKAPLIIPPDYNLRPPKPGAPPLNQVSPTQSAQVALFSENAATIAAAMPGNSSNGEKLLLATAGAENANNAVRQLIAADNASMQAADQSFTDRLLFGGPDPNQGTPVDANAEAARIKAAMEAGKPVNGGPMSKEKGGVATIQKESSSDKDSGGWLDGIF